MLSGNLWSFIAADISFIRAKLHQPNTFASSCRLRRRDCFGLRWFAACILSLGTDKQAPRALTLGALA